MLEKPELQDALIRTCLHQAYGLQLDALAFLPLGADVNTAVYRLVSQDGKAYFFKLRKGSLDEITVAIPQFLHAQGIQAIIPPLETLTGALWTTLGEYQVILYPFVPGRDGYQAAMSDPQWLAFGAALRAVHTAQIPPALANRIPRETFSAEIRELVRFFQTQVETWVYEDPTAARLAVFMQSRRAEIDRLLLRADTLGAALQARHLEQVLCHADIHPGNLHLGDPETLYIVDWDNPMLAPKERDLALIGGTGAWKDPRAVDLFYRGYGKAPVDAEALTYYRCERILMDIAAFCQQLLLSTEGGEDREQSYRYFTSQFEPGQEVELATR